MQMRISWQLTEGASLFHHPENSYPVNKVYWDKIDHMTYVNHIVSISTDGCKGKPSNVPKYLSGLDLILLPRQVYMSYILESNKKTYDT